MTKDEALRLSLDAMEYTFACSKNQLTTKTKREYDQDLLMKAINSIKQALETKDEPLITVDDLEQEIYENTREFISFNVMKWMIKKFYTTPQRTEQEPVEYCTAYYCAGDCGQPHNQKEMQEFLRAQPEQEQGEPVAWRLESGQAVWFERTDPEASSALPNDVTAIPLYTTPQPQREWVGLTDEEANQLWESTDSDWELMKRTEAKLRSKNT